MTVYIREDADGNRATVDQDQFLMDQIRGKVTIRVNTKDMCVYRPNWLKPTHTPAHLKYGGRGRMFKNPAGYGGY